MHQTHFRLLRVSYKLCISSGRIVSGQMIIYVIHFVWLTLRILWHFLVFSSRVWHWTILFEQWKIYKTQHSQSVWYFKLFQHRLECLKAEAYNNHSTITFYTTQKPYHLKLETTRIFHKYACFMNDCWPVWRFTLSNSKAKLLFIQFKLLFISLWFSIIFSCMHIMNLVYKFGLLLFE